MAEGNTTTPEQEKEATEQAEPSFQMVRAFFKDASLEMPHAPDIFLTSSRRWTLSSALQPVLWR